MYCRKPESTLEGMPIGTYQSIRPQPSEWLAQKANTGMPLLQTGLSTASHWMALLPMQNPCRAVHALSEQLEWPRY